MEKRYTETRLLAECKARYWTVAGVAKRMGYDGSYIYAVARKDRSISHEFVARACRVFGCEPELLFSKPVDADATYWAPFKARDHDPNRKARAATPTG
jgi:transcriptional regulator with XRE-family HTH domain